MEVQSMKLFGGETTRVNKYIFVLIYINNYYQWGWGLGAVVNNVIKQQGQPGLFHVPNGFHLLGPLVASQNVSIKVYDWLF